MIRLCELKKVVPVVQVVWRS